MTIFLPTVAVAFAAICVWLIVRIVNRRERWAKWTAVTLGVLSPVLYVLGSGPLVWLIHHDRLPASAIPQIELLYSPLSWFYDNGPAVIHDLLDSYLDLWEN